jgi:hypothetical protein
LRRGGDERIGRLDPMVAVSLRGELCHRCDRRPADSWSQASCLSATDSSASTATTSETSWSASRTGRRATGSRTRRAAGSASSRSTRPRILGATHATWTVELVDG